MDTKWAEADKDIVKGIHGKLNRLTDLEQVVIKKRSYENVAAEYNLSSGRIRQIEKRAVRKMEKPEPV